MPDVFNKVISFISGDSDGGSDKDILLKQLTKEISQNKYAKFYRVKQGDLEPAFAQYFFGLYRTVYPLIVFLNDPQKELKIKQITLEAFLDKQVMDMIKKLSPEEIAARKKSAGAELPKQLEEDLAVLARGFDSPRIAAADICYDLIVSLKQFVSFDFCSLLRKFDSEMREGDFLSQSKFVETEASIVVPDIAAFLTVLPPFEKENDWKTVFEILKYCKGGTDVILLDQWNSVLVSLKDLRDSKILGLIGKLGSANPVWEVKHRTAPHETLSASWLEQKNREVREIIAGIAGSQRNAQINALVNAVFGSPEVTRLEFLTPEKGKILLDKELDSYTYAPALNHLYVFIQDFLGKEIHELCDILLIRGKWTNNAASRQMSEAYHNILDITNKITELDQSLEDDASNGSRLRGALLRVDRDKSQGRYINSIINTINEEALNMLNQAVPNLIVVGKHFKMLLDDYDKKPFELIMNWKELASVSKNPINQRIATAYKKINYFVQLMLLETKPLEEEI